MQGWPDSFAFNFRLSVLVVYSSFVFSEVVVLFIMCGTKAVNHNLIVRFQGRPYNIVVFDSIKIRG